MRVLHLDAGREMRGGQRQVGWLVAALAERSVEQRILARGPLRELLDVGEIGPWAVLREGGWADLIHAHDAKSHTLAAVLRPDKPLVVSRRVAFPPKRGWASRWKYGRAARILAVSEYVREQVVAAGVPPGRVEVVHDAAPGPAVEPPWRPPAKPPAALALESADPLKGTALARRSCESAGLPLRLTRDLDADLPAADVFLYLSESEGLGSALIAASLAKKAIVASRVGGIPEIVLDGETGLLTSNDADSVVAALRRIAADGELARRCAEAAYRRARERFSIATMAERTIAAYRAVLGR